MTAPGSRSHISRVELLIALLVLVSCAYFHGGAAGNQNARLDAIFSFVETGSFRIDRFLPAPERGINTNDWSSAGGHYYANKAPGSILIGSVAYAALYRLQTWTGASPEAPLPSIFNSYLINVATSGLWIALAALLFFRMLRRSVDGPTACFLTLGLFLGTGLFPYATQLWGHVTAAAFLVIGMYALHARTTHGAFWGAFFFGWAVATDYLAIVAVALLSLSYLWAQRRHAAWVFAGALIPACALLGYQWLCFGSPWSLSTGHSNPAFLAKERALGMFAGPDLGVWVKIFFGAYRGVFLHMPVLLLVVAAFFHWWRRDRRDPWLWGCLLTAVFGSLTVSAFNGWHGGATVLQRYMLLFLPVAFLATKELAFSPSGKALALALGALSIANMLAIAAVNPLCPDRHPNPLYGYTYSMLGQGQVAPYDLPIRLLSYQPEWSLVKQWTAWNWGHALGLHGIATLLPLLAFWAVCAVLLQRTLRDERS